MTDTQWYNVHLVAPEGYSVVRPCKGMVETGEMVLTAAEARYELVNVVKSGYVSPDEDGHYPARSVDNGEGKFDWAPSPVVDDEWYFM